MLIRSLVAGGGEDLRTGTLPRSTNTPERKVKWWHQHIAQES
jgi:hypothetical protein